MFSQKFVLSKEAIISPNRDLIKVLFVIYAQTTGIKLSRDNGKNIFIFFDSQLITFLSSRLKLSKTSFINLSKKSE